jgi:magnesium-transporting ATPase (P-type)
MSSEKREIDQEITVSSANSNVAEKVEGKNVEKRAAEIIEHKHVEMAEDIPPELEALLHTDPQVGLTTTEAQKRLAEFGKNELAEVKRNPILKFLSFFTGAIAYLIELSCIFAAVVQHWVIIIFFIHHSLYL